MLKRQLGASDWRLAKSAKNCGWLLAIGSWRKVLKRCMAFQMSDRIVFKWIAIFLLPRIASFQLPMDSSLSFVIQPRLLTN
jgi:hypothetical protein